MFSTFIQSFFNKKLASAVDPVCHMNVNISNPVGGTSEHAGKTYYFCADGCHVAFESDPGKYLSNP